MIVLILAGCREDQVEFFSLEEEKRLGQELLEYVTAADDLIILGDEYQPAYDYINVIMDDLLGLDDPDSMTLLNLRDEFQWQVLIVNDSKLDAYATPGGYLYLNTALIKLLDSPDELAALLSHLIVHIDNRHVTKQLLKNCSSAILQSAASGNDTASLAKVAENLFGQRIAFNYSIGDEQEAETLGVAYLSNTQYDCSSSISFNQRLTRQFQQGRQPAFYSTHTELVNRADLINVQVASLECNTDNFIESGFTYQNFKNSLP